MRLEGRDRRFHEEREERHPVALILGRGVELFAVGFQLGDISLVLVCDVRYVEPGALQVRPRDLLDSRKWLDLDRSKLRKILRRDLGDAGACWRGSPNRPRRGAP